MLFKEDALFYADQVKKGSVTPLELVDRALDNVHALNPKLNALITLLEDEAREEAQAQTALVEKMTPTESAALPPFFGVPIFLKDLGQTLKGAPATSGAGLLKDSIAKESDNFAKGVQEAGFIILGRTNVPEFGYKGIADSQSFGPVESPIKPGHNPGGSSGGAAAAVKSGMVPIATASDGGGSIRVPAGYTGLIGLKPSRGRTPVGPANYRSWQSAASNFALTKSVRDTWALLKHLQVEQLEAPFSLPKIEAADLKAIDRPLNIAYSLKGVLGGDLPDQAKAAVLHAKDKLEQLGHVLVEDTPDLDMEKIMRSYYKMNSIETRVMLDAISIGMGRPIAFEDVEPLTWLMYQAGDHVRAADMSRMHGFWDQVGAKATEFFSNYDAILYPVSNGSAPMQGEFDPSADLVEQIKEADQLDPERQQDLIWDYFDESNHYLGFSAQVNLAGHPSIALPLYENEDGMPIGVQVWSQKGAEYLLLQIAKQLEDAGYLSADIVE